MAWQDFEWSMNECDSTLPTSHMAFIQARGLNIAPVKKELSDERGEKRKATYLYLKEHFKITSFIMESGCKLQLPPVAVSTACVLYHRFWTGCNTAEFDPFLIATTALYLASKSEEVPCKVRDVINVCYRSTHKDKPCLEVGPRYWELRDSVVNCELLMLRVLGFRVVYDNPHKYLLHYLKSLQDWVESDMWTQSHVAQLSWSILKDTHHMLLSVEHSPALTALAVLYLAVLCTGMHVPSDEAHLPWWKALCNGCEEHKLQLITEDIMDLYDYESKPF